MLVKDVSGLMKEAPNASLWGCTGTMAESLPEGTKDEKLWLSRG